MDNIINLAKKLKALSEKGVGGEKVNADRMLKRMMAKHGLTIEDVEGEKTNYAYFKVNLIQAQIFGQIVSSVLGSKFSTYTDKRKRGYRLLLITATQAIEIEMKYSFYWKLYKDELEIFRHAFIATNNIYDPDADKVDVGALTPEEQAEIRRVAQMAENIKRGEFRRQLK